MSEKEEARTQVEMCQECHRLHPDNLDRSCTICRSTLKWVSEADFKEQARICHSKIYWEQEPRIEGLVAENKKLQDEKAVMEKCIYENDAENMQLEGSLLEIRRYLETSKLAEEMLLAKNKGNYYARWKLCVIESLLGVLFKEGDKKP